MQVNRIPAGGNYSSNYSVFEWDGTSWLLVENCCDYACAPAAPGMPGTYVGERSVTPCQPKLEGLSGPPSE
jgi:hypothetical protein